MDARPPSRRNSHTLKSPIPVSQQRRRRCARARIWTQATSEAEDARVHEGRVGDGSSLRVLQVFDLLGCRALHLPWRLSLHRKLLHHEQGSSAWSAAFPTTKRCDDGRRRCAASAEGATPAHSHPSRPWRAVVVSRAEWNVCVKEGQPGRDQPENSRFASGPPSSCLLSVWSRAATGLSICAGFPPTCTDSSLAPTITSQSHAVDERPPFRTRPSCEPSSDGHDEAGDGEYAEPAARAATPRSSAARWCRQCDCRPLPTRIRTGTPAVRRQSPAGLTHWTYVFVPLCTRSTTHRPRPRRSNPHVLTNRPHMISASDTSNQSWLLPSNRIHERHS
ncbi:hypothetical protein BD626DRAFT_520990 [Schizophyllum amplum]|uniref:Uncharacterized protein n=1 Tax=Schizophyllum amplum TaxID=97359 RepID=A0A550BU46_9AGAR|nr:hypothetical protein BD626DRAFT_520990 [Auriculariopsis ampla]